MTSSNPSLPATAPITKVRNETRPLLATWLLLALAALAVSTVCAVMLVAARIPLPAVTAAVGALFGRALVLHVNLAVIVWFLACAAGIWVLAAGNAAGVLRWGAAALAVAGLPAMVLSLFLGDAQPVLANYVPVLDHPLFLTGLVLLVAGVALCGATSLGSLLRRLRQGAIEPWRLGALLSMAAAAVALAALLASLAHGGLPVGPDGFEIMAWAPGHILQFVHVLLLMSVWTMLGEAALGQPVAQRRSLVALLSLTALPLLAVPLIYVLHPVDSGEFRRAFTLLMAWGTWPAAALLGMRLMWRLVRAGRAVWASPAALPLLLSVVLFLLGCVLGASIRAESTIVPAHYHGTVGAVTLAYMAMAYRLLPAFGMRAEEGALARWQPLLYGGGLLILALALAGAGWLGVPRKTLHVDALAQFPGYFVAMGLAGVGGFMGICGAALFVVNIFRSVRGSREKTLGRDVRLPALVLTLVLVTLAGLLIAYLPGGVGSVSAHKDPVTHVSQKRKEEVRRRFTEGAELLRNKQYEAAASAFHRVLELAPRMPEAHANMGFAMLGMEKHAMARDFFESAINLRTTQMNAYYGLAVALEATGDVEGALGAMRTYVHQSNPDDPFVRKANAAIWEWEEQIARSRQSTPQAQNDTSPLPGIPESGKGAVRYPITEKKLN